MPKIGILYTIYFGIYEHAHELAYRILVLYIWGNRLDMRILDLSKLRMLVSILNFWLPGTQASLCKKTAIRMTSLHEVPSQQPLRACLPEYFMYYNYLKRLGTRQGVWYI